MQNQEAKFFDNEGVMLSGTCVPEATMLDENGNELTLPNGNSTFEAKVIRHVNSKGEMECTIYGLYHMVQNYLYPYSVDYEVVS
jgi:hypothetical protein